MLALVDSVVVHVEPALEVQGGFSVDRHGPFKGEGQLIPRYGGHPIYGAVFYKMEGDNARIDPKTGVFKMQKGERTRFRAIFNGTHQDIEL